MKHYSNVNDFSSSFKIIILINAMCFLLGAITHWIHIWTGGLFPYHSVPFGFNLFLTSLALLDLIICWLLIKRTTLGFMLGMLLTTVDLPVHVYLCNNYWNECNVWSNSGILLLMGFAVFLGVSALVYVIKIVAR